MIHRSPDRQPRNNEPRVSGVVNLHKPVGQSSAQYVYKLRRIYNERKVGHAGTLDPFADGVLLACLGRGTKLVERIMRLPKTYLTTLRLGVTNETFDTERPFTPVEGASPLSETQVIAGLDPFRGEIDQAPPAFSAVKIDGVPSYRLARRGGDHDRPTKRVVIYEMNLISYAWPSLTLRIVCGRGTYIRSIARDLGRDLGCGACCETLCREAVGPFRDSDALRLPTATQAEIDAALIPLDRAEEMIGEFE